MAKLIEIYYMLGFNAVFVCKLPSTAMRYLSWDVLYFQHFLVTSGYSWVSAVGPRKRLAHEESLIARYNLYTFNAVSVCSVC